MPTPDVTPQTDALKIAVAARDAAIAEFKATNLAFEQARDNLSVTADALIAAQNDLNVALGADTRPKVDTKVEAALVAKP